MSAQRVASRYAKALVEIAVEQDKLEQVNEDVQTFLSVMKNREFELLVKSPIVNTNKKMSIFNAIFSGKISEITDKFFKIVLRKKRESYLPHIANAFVEQYKVIKNISTVTVTSAKTLSDTALNAIKDKLSKSGEFSKNIELNTKVDKSLIGGFRLEFGDRLYDTSVSYKLEQLKKEFKNNNYIKKS